MSLGDLQAEILGILQKLGKATAREVMSEIGERKHVAYTTVSTVLDRLNSRGLVKRSKVTGRGGAKYVYSYSAAPEIQTTFIQRALNQLVNAFGPSVVPAIYDSLEQISKDESDELKRKVNKARK